MIWYESVIIVLIGGVFGILFGIVFGVLFVVCVDFI